MQRDEKKSEIRGRLPVGCSAMIGGGFDSGCTRALPHLLPMPMPMRCASALHCESPNQSLLESFPVPGFATALQSAVGE